MYVELLIYEDTGLWFISIDDNIRLKEIYYESLNPKRIWLILQRSFVSHVVIRQVERYVLYIQINYISMQNHNFFNVEKLTDNRFNLFNMQALLFKHTYLTVIH